MENMVYLPLAFSPDSRYVLVGSAAQAHLWDTKTGAKTYPFKDADDGGSVTTVAFSPDGKQVLTAKTTGKAYIWDVATGRKIKKLDLRVAVGSGVGTDASFSPDGRYVLLPTWDNKATIFEVSTGKQLYQLQLDKLMLFFAAFSPDGKRVLTGSNDAEVLVWQLPDSGR